jgi:diaminopimelate epimerase
MQISFHKYQGTGNDFIIMDNRNHSYHTLLDKKQIAMLCDRRFGIGGDGLILLNAHSEFDFEMLYYNADGATGSMCGNGSRCIVQFANDMGIQKSAYTFLAADGKHEARIQKDGSIVLKMNDVARIDYINNDAVLNTGSPHYVQFCTDVRDLNVYQKGRDIRYSARFEKEGINVNFVRQLDDRDSIYVRTYERGVEDETFSCGTGVTAAALVCHYNKDGYNNIKVKTPGGNLSVSFEKYENTFTNIWLSGPADKVFEGVLEISEMGIE